MLAHTFEQSGLKLKKVRIGRNIIIGLNSIVFPGVEIGDNTVITAGAIVPKETHVAPATTFGSFHEEK